jgi:hypothetical protein
MLSDLLDLLSLSELSSSYSLCLSIGLLSKESKINQGFVKLNGKKELITKYELETLISEFKIPSDLLKNYYGK